MDPNSLFTTFQLLICVLVLYYGISGKGSAYKDETIHVSMREKFKKYMRLFCLIFGPVGIAGSYLDMKGYTTLGYVFTGLFMIGLIWIGAMSVRMSDAHVKKKQDKLKGGK